MFFFSSLSFRCALWFPTHGHFIQIALNKLEASEVPSDAPMYT